MTAIWPDSIVEENNLTQNISNLRRVLGEKHGQNQFIATVPGHGYRFVAAIRQVNETDQSAAPEHAGVMTPEARDQPAPASARTIKGSFANRFGNRFISLCFGFVVPEFMFRENQHDLLNPAKPSQYCRSNLASGKTGRSLELGMADTLISKLSGVDTSSFVHLGDSQLQSWDQDLCAGRELESRPPSTGHQRPREYQNWCAVVRTRTVNNVGGH